MNTPPENPTENPELDRLNAEVLELNEAIAKQKHIKWLASVEVTRLERSLKATITSIETITKGPES